MEELRKQLAELINNTQIPFDAKFYVLKDVYREVYDVYQNILKQQKEIDKEKQANENETAKDEAEQTE